MNCPNCGNVMEKAMGLLRPKAYLCRNCRTVTVKY